MLVLFQASMPRLAGVPRTPMPLERAVQVASEAIQFFGLGPGQHRGLQVLGRDDDPESWRTLFSVSDFVTFLGRTCWEDARNWQSQIDRLLRSMSREEFLIEATGRRKRRPVFANKYVAWDGLTRGQRDGNLWMTPFLGAPLLVHALQASVVHLTGYDEHGTARGGSGLVIGPTHILTAKHVVDDMTLDETIGGITDQAEGTPAQLVDVLRHPNHDLAVVVTAEPSASLSPPRGLVSRDPTWSDVVYLLGFPPVPTAARAELTVQRGEVVNPAVTTYHGAELFLYSAVARPGNSGGPIIGADGRLHGLVTQELVLDADHVPQPFYAGLPPRLIHECLADLGLAHLLEAERWT
jgi:S1-C subfamily serine protease